MATYICGHCGTRGHNRRTCPHGHLNRYDARNAARLSAAPSTPAPAPFLAGVTGNLQDDWESVKVGDIVRAYRRSDGSDCTWTIRSEVTSVEDRLIQAKSAEAMERYPVGTELSFDRDAYLLRIAGRASEPAPQEKPAKPWERASMVIDSQRITLLYGPPGTGKTYAANKSPGAPAMISNITATEETPAAELRGHFIPKGGEFFFMHGPALDRFKNGGRLVINEVDKLSGDALQFLNALLDDADIAAITLPTGETVHPHPDFSCVATMNGEPDDLPESLADRFTVAIRIDKPHPDAVKTLPKDLQKAARNGISADGRAISLRGWKKYAELREIHGEVNAAATIFGESWETILNTLKIDKANFQNYSEGGEE